MEPFVLETSADLALAAALSLHQYQTLRQHQPWLPEKSLADLAGPLKWVAKEGLMLGLGRPGALEAFWGGFVLGNFRNLGPGGFCPDFAHGFGVGVDPFRATRTLYRALASRWVAQGIRVHAAATYASEPGVLEALSLTGFGRIVADLSRPCSDLETDLALGKSIDSVAVHRASSADVPHLFRWETDLARHIGASPVFMPDTHGRSVPEWEQWLIQPDAVAFVATLAGQPVGFLRAADPQEDVSLAVHGASTLAINGLWVDPGVRGMGVARALLTGLVHEASQRQKDLVSVDCETMNPEAWAFWSRWFTVVSWSLERRT